MSFAVAGEGPLVILLHGITATLEMWRKSGVFEALSQRFTVAALDVRGHGASTLSDEAQFYGAEMVNDGFRLLDHLGYETAHWVGYSMGSSIALKAASTQPQRVRSLVLGGYGFRDSAAWIEGARKTASSLRAGHGFGEFFSFIPPGQKARVHLRPETVRAILRRNDPGSIAALLEQAHELEVTQDELRGIHAPTLCLAGHLDSAHERAQKLVDLMPSCQLIGVRGTHFSAVTDAEFANEINRFLLAQERDT